MVFIHEHLHELVFNHFDEADVLILSEVSTRWFDVIGGSKKCMTGIRLGLENWWQSETPKDISKVMKVVSKTTRKYQNVHINCNDDILVSKHAFKLLETLAPSLVDLRFMNADGIIETAFTKFPRLERLQFINNVKEVDELLLQGSTTIKELNMKHHYWAEVEPVLKCLKANKDLTILKLWDTGIGKLFQAYQPGCFKFKLKRFATGCDGQISKESEKNFLHFLGSQSEHLDAIRFRSGLDGVNHRIINKVFSLSAIKIIHIDGIDSLSDIQLQVNPGIIELRLPWKVDSAEKLLPFLEAAPNLEVLSLKKINRAIVEIIATSLKNLKLLNYDRAEGCRRCLKGSLSVTEDSNKDIELKHREWY